MSIRCLTVVIDDEADGGTVRINHDGMSIFEAQSLAFYTAERLAARIERAMNDSNDGEGEEAEEP